MTTNGSKERSGRETRLLVLVVVVSLAVLLVLARFRFPAATLSVAPPAPSPLSNLANRAAFHDLADAMVAAYERIAPRVAILQLEPVKTDGRGRAAGPGSISEAGPPRVAPALRVRPDLVLVYVPDGFAVAALAGSPAEVVASNTTRAIALVRVPVVAEPRTGDIVEGFAGFAYVVEVTAAGTGPGVQPVFIGRAGAREDTRWPAGVVGVDHTGLTAGSFVFTLEGRLVGLVLRDADATALVPPSTLERAVDELLSASGMGS